jgi:2-succinyl-6-hydroxy-2,4-cyclohexadiene-1-carboxylate synthase
MNAIQINNIHWYYTLTGDRNLPPLLLLHGWMGSCEDYSKVIRLLGSQYYCIAIDLPGHGKTEVSGDDRSYEFIATAEGIIQLLDRLKIDRTAITGYSFGGRLALYLALEYPDRFDRVILESTSPGLKTATERNARILNDAQIIHQLETDNFSDFVANWYRQKLFTGIDTNPDFPSLLDRRMTNNPTNLAKSLKYAGLATQPYLGDRLKVHPQPILLLVGALDRKFVSIAQTLTQTSPHITLSIIPNCSHNIHFQQADVWTSGVRDFGFWILGC